MRIDSLLDGATEQKEVVVSPFDSPRDPYLTCEECPRYEECLGPHECLLTEDPDAYDEDKENILRQGGNYERNKTMSDDFLGCEL